MTAALRLFDDADTGCVLTREWAMPNRWTFTIPPIARLIGRHMNDGVWLNPFAGFHVVGTVTNDINPEMPTQFHMDASRLPAGAAAGKRRRRSL